MEGFHVYRIDTSSHEIKVTQIRKVLSKMKLKRLLRRSFCEVSWLLKGKKEFIKVRRQGLIWELGSQNCIDRAIIRIGAWEEKSTQLVRKFVEPGMHILDVGANIGYFTTIFAQLVGPTGKVWAFEPVGHFRKRIYRLLELNNLLSQSLVNDYGLSDREQEVDITIAAASATIHPVSSGESSVPTEVIRLKRLDDVYSGLGIKRCDLIKVDIDGHEPFFIEGARQFLRKYQPVIMIEFAQNHLYIANRDVLSLRQQLENFGYTLYSERTGKPFSSTSDFLVECGNFTHSANVWAYPSDSPVNMPRI